MSARPVRGGATERPRTTLLVLLAWVVWSLVRGSGGFLRGEIDDQAALENQFDVLVASLLWAGLTPLVRRLALTWRAGRAPLSRLIPVHLAASLVLGVLHVAALDALLVPLRQLTFSPEAWRYAVWFDLAFLHHRLLTYAGVVGAVWAFETAREARESVRRLELVQRELAESRLLVLAGQLNPAFFFSTLDAILVRIRRDADDAANLVVRLGEVLRQTLRADGVSLVPLRDELESLEPYAEIERARRSRGAAFSFDVEPGAREVPVPGLLLQPIARFLWDLSGASGSDSLHVSARVAGGRLTCSVDRPDARITGWDADPPELLGVRERVRLLYDGAGLVELERGARAGLLVRVSVPTSPAQTGGGPG